MDIEDFKIAREISSLSSKKQALNNDIQNEKQRITVLENRRNETKQDGEKLKLELQDERAKLQKIENALAKHEKQLEQDQKHLQSANNQAQADALEKSLSYCKNAIDQLESEGFSLLEVIESLEEELKEKEGFLKGIASTLLEIEKDVNSKIQDLDIEICKLNERLELLFGQLPPLFAEKIQSVMKKNHQISSFTRIMGSVCEFCKLTVSRNDLTKIEDHLEAKTCSGCGRLFLPLQSFH